MSVLAPKEVDEYILETEERIIRVRQHWAVMLSPLLQTIAVFLLLIIAERNLPDSVVLDNLFFYTALVVVVRFAFIVAFWWVERVVVTNKRVVRAQGIITHKVGMMPLGKVTDLTYERTLTGRSLGYGNLIIESAGQNQAFDRIDFLPNPEEIYEAISQLVFGEKKKKEEPKPPPAARPSEDRPPGGPAGGAPAGAGPVTGGFPGGPDGWHAEPGAPQPATQPMPGGPVRAQAEIVDIQPSPRG